MSMDPSFGITQEALDSMNVMGMSAANKEYLEQLGGVESLLAKLNISPATGLTKAQIEASRAQFGPNVFPETPMKGFLMLFFEAFQDTTLLILLAAAAVSLGIGLYEHPDTGYIEGLAIFIAVFLVASISAGNDYSKELQFKALQSTAAEDERASALRDGTIERINPRDLVVGDILVLQAGDQINADAVIIDDNVVLCNESGLTGEPDDLKKSKHGDAFLLSSCLITEGNESHAIVIGVGIRSQWGKIKANLASEAVNTPLQDKLEDMTNYVGYIGIIAAIGTFAAKIIRIFTVDSGKEDPAEGVISAFILAVTIVVVAIPEGLPLAVTIALAYSTKQMYKDNNFIRVLAACETMGNVTNICSDKTGTLTENRMTVVEGYFGNKQYDQEEFKTVKLPEKVLKYVCEQSCLNRVAYLVHKDEKGDLLHRPNIIGNKTEGALMLMSKNWGFDYAELEPKMFNSSRDKIFSFNSAKKRSTCIVHRPDGSVTVFVKGATEWIIKDCTKVFDGASGQDIELTKDLRSHIDGVINGMAERALRTLCLAHKDYRSASDLPNDWQTNPPDHTDLICDCIVGIIDPLRDDVKEAVATAQRAGVTVRMVTGDNIVTARAIARQCGIFTNGIAIEGPAFRKLTPKELDEILPRIQVMARASPDDKYLLVTRLNGNALPKNQEEWEKKHADKTGVSWEKDRDLLLPGYREEWEKTRPGGGQVVGVTGDGTNDAPALKAADVGLAMGITGTKVAQGASDIVILDDKFSSIVKAILWGRSVYDNIRKFLQFQLTVNLVALNLVFISACSGVETPLNAVQMLWVNLVMDTMGALALATEPPTKELLERKPYKRETSLISNPMKRNIVAQAAFQLTLLLVLLYEGPDLFGVPKSDHCVKFDSSAKCLKYDYTIGSIIFNTFIWCQIFNEYTARSIFDEWNALRGIMNNKIFLYVSIFSVGAQVFLVEVGGDFVKTVHLNVEQWFICIALGAIGAVIGVLMRFIPVVEDPNDFFDNSVAYDECESKESEKLAALPSYSKVLNIEVEPQCEVSC